MTITTGIDREVGAQTRAVYFAAIPNSEYKSNEYAAANAKKDALDSNILVVGGDSFPVLPFQLCKGQGQQLPARTRALDYVALDLRGQPLKGLQRVLPLGLNVAVLSACSVGNAGGAAPRRRAACLRLRGRYRTLWMNVHPADAAAKGLAGSLRMTLRHVVGLKHYLAKREVARAGATHQRNAAIAVPVEGFNVCGSCSGCCCCGGGFL